MATQAIESYPNGWRSRLYTVIFGYETRGGRLFDISLLWVILASILVVMLESVQVLAGDPSYMRLFLIAEWAFTLFFATEYVLRLLSLKRPLDYVFSFFGLVDFLSILPTFLAVLIPGAAGLLTIRALRLLRVFRILKLVGFLNEAEVLAGAMKASMRKIAVFLGAVIIVVMIVGSAMYLIEGGKGSGFTSIPRSVYWAIVTMTTVGYGDIAPTTVLGQTLASILMVVGYGVIAVPTGIISAEMATGSATVHQACSRCPSVKHDSDASFCKQCGGDIT